MTIKECVQRKANYEKILDSYKDDDSGFVYVMGADGFAEKVPMQDIRLAFRRSVAVEMMNIQDLMSKKPKLVLWVYNKPCDAYLCSACGGIGQPMFKYCPHCGAKMMEVEE